MANRRSPTAFSKDPTRGMRSWSVGDDTYRPIREAIAKIPSGLYEIAYDGGGVFMQRHRLETDNFIDLQDKATASVVQEIEAFWELKARFEELGLIHKRGALMYGPAGTGKTAAALQIAQIACDQHDAVAVIIDNAGLAAAMLESLRKIEPERRIVAVLEDLDELLEEDESGYTMLLDGEKQIGNVVFLATTNHREKLPQRIVNRPSRFDIVKRIDVLTAKARMAFLKAKEPNMPERVLDELVERSKGMTIAHLKELLILVRAYGLKVDDAIKRIRGMMDGKEEEVE